MENVLAEDSRAIRTGTTVAVLLVAVIAAIVSFVHIEHLAAYLLPVSIAGTVTGNESSLGAARRILAAFCRGRISKQERPDRWPPRLCLTLPYRESHNVTTAHAVTPHFSRSTCLPTTAPGGVVIPHGFSGKASDLKPSGTTPFDPGRPAPARSLRAPGGPAAHYHLPRLPEGLTPVRTQWASRRGDYLGWLWVLMSRRSEDLAFGSNRGNAVNTSPGRLR